MEMEHNLQHLMPSYVNNIFYIRHSFVLKIAKNPKDKRINNPTERPKVENHNIGTMIPATNEEKSICINAWPDAAVPLIFGN